MYPTKTATTGTPISLSMAKLIDLPAIPDNQNRYASYANYTPIFFSGQTPLFSLDAYSISSNMPTLWSESYSTAGPVFAANLVMGVSTGAYAIRQGGPNTAIASDNTGYYQEQGYIDGLYLGHNHAFRTAGNALDGYQYYVDLKFERQKHYPLLGGTAAPVTANAEETASFAFPYNLTNTYHTIIVPALASTTTTPVALSVFNLQDTGPSNDDEFHCYRIPETGAITVKSLFKTDVAAHTTQGLQTSIHAHCMDATYHYFIRNGVNPGPEGASFTRCVESAYGVFSYNNYTPIFNDPDLPTYLSQLIHTSSDQYLQTGYLGNQYQFVAMYGTDLGFVISYKKLVSGTWKPKFILVDKAWTTVQHITVTGDATTNTILSQGDVANSSVPAPPADTSNQFFSHAISLMMHGGKAYLLGGNPQVPLIVEGTTGGITPPTAPTVDNNVNLRVWSFSLDGHDFYVLRVGPSCTLVYDLTTETWSEWQSPELPYWRAHAGQNWIGMDVPTFARSLGSDIVAGDDTTGILWVLDPKAGRDDTITTGSAPYTRVVTGGVRVAGRNVIPNGAVTLDLAVGGPTQSLATATLAISDDSGNNWIDCGTVTVPAADYDTVVEWRGLGLIKAPGRLFRFTDNGATVRIGGADLR